MALLFCDSFDYYTSTQILRKWSTAASSTNLSITTTAGRNGTNGLTTIGAANVFINLAAGVSTIIVGGAFRFPSAAVPAWFLYLNDATVSHLQLAYNADGSVSVIRAENTTLATSAAGVLPSPATVHNYIEMKATIDDSAGAVEVRVNGVTVINISGVDTRNAGTATVTRVGFASALPNASQRTQVDDFYICNTAGSVNNTFLGDVRIQAILPNGAGATTDFTPSAGSNFQCVDDATANDDTDYVSSSTVGHKDTYAMGALTPTSGTVLAVAMNTVDRKDDAGTRTHAHVVRHSGTETTGTAFAPATSYANHQTIFETKPGGGSWSISDVNAMEAGQTIAS